MLKLPTLIFIILLMAPLNSYCLPQEMVKNEGIELLVNFSHGITEEGMGLTGSNNKKNRLIDYNNFGKFEGLGTENYKYTITYPGLLKEATDVGIFPNDKAIFETSGYRDFLKNDKPYISFWDYLRREEFNNAFYKIATDNSLDVGVRTLLTALVFENAGYIYSAINTYYTALINFPRSIVDLDIYGIKKSYVGQVAISSINRLIRDYPDLHLTLDHALFTVENGDDFDTRNDIIKIDPGEFRKTKRADKVTNVYLEKSKFKKETVRGKISIVELQDGDWFLKVKDDPFFIKGIYYNPMDLDFSPLKDIDNLNSWMNIDSDNDSVIDAPFESWVDKNNNEKEDVDERPVGDLRLLKDIGINAVVIYVKDATSINKEMLRNMYETYGIYVIIGNYLGAYTVGSDASWQNGTDYTDKEQLKKMMGSVEDTVEYFKDEPYVLMWLLGYGNNMPIIDNKNIIHTNASQHPQEYAEFINSVSKRIHEIDPDHPVAVSSFDVNNLSYFAGYSPEIDILGINTNRGCYGFLGLWEEVRKTFNKPVFISRFGPDVYRDNKGFVDGPQLNCYVDNYRDIVFNQAGGGYGGNSIGGVISEFMDYPWDDFLKGKDKSKKNQYLFMKEISDSLSFNGKHGIVRQGKNENNLTRTLNAGYDYFKNVNDSIKKYTNERRE